MAKRFESEVTWNYRHDADVTIGELHESKLPKIILGLLVAVLIATIAAGIYFRDVIYDLIVRPEIILKEEEITLEVNSEFNPEDYVARLPGNGEQPDRYEIIYPSPSSINMEKVGDYSVPYTVILKRNGKQYVTRLVVHVEDSTPPTIKLSTNEVELTRDVDNFKCMTYVMDVKDNYDQTVKATCSDKIDWSADKYEVEYLAQDLSGNLAVEKLTLRIKDKPSANYVCWDGSLVWKASDCPIRPSSSGGNSGGNSGGSSGGDSSSSSGGGSSQPVYTEPEPSAPYINVPSGCSMSVNGDASGMISCLSNVDTNVQVALDFSSVNYTVAGTYPVYYSGGGLEVTGYVTVTE